jgi:small subunit ribosomal protein S6
MRKYELVVLFPTSVNDVVAEKNISDKCEKRKVEIGGLVKWGVKVLAYPIKKLEKAYYLKYDLEVEDSTKIVELDKDLRMDESILRYLLVLAANVKIKKVKKGKESK